MESPPPALKIFEALLFSTHQPLSIQEICKIMEVRKKEIVLTWIEKLNEFYSTNDRAFKVCFAGGGYQLRTDPDCKRWIRKLEKVKMMRFSPALLQTLSIVAYKQPIIRADVESIRTVDCSHTLRQLLHLNLVKIIGKSDLPGRPILYGTTDYFLEVFDCSSLDELPKPEEFDLGFEEPKDEDFIPEAKQAEENPLFEEEIISNVQHNK